MRGSIKKRSEGSWTIILDAGRDPATGRRKQQWLSVKGTKKEAEKKLAEMLHQLDSGTFIKPGKTTLAEYLDRWLKDYAWPNLAPRTAEGYEHISRRHLIPGLGSLTLTGLRPEHIQRYYTDKLSGGRLDGKGALSAKTVRHHHVTLHTALETAKKWGLIVRNPADAVTPPHPQRTEMHTLDEDDLPAFLEAARETDYHACFYTLLFTGLRRSEALALRWADVDLLLCQIHVTRSLHHLRSGGTVIRAPKSAKSRRMVALSPSTALVLQGHRDKQSMDRALMGTVVRDEDFVFSDLEGKPLQPDTVTHAWMKLARRTGLKGVRLHDARHTHASLLLRQGVHPKIVQERLGHSSIAITLDTYSHVAPGLQEAAALGFDRLVAPRREKEAVK